jgi:hypothetical protein
MVVWVCSISAVHYRLEQWDRRSRGVEFTTAERMISWRRVAYSWRLCWVGFSCRELHKGYFMVERFWSMEVKVSQLVFVQLR